MSKEEDFERIERYLRKEMPSEEQQDFEQELQSNAELKGEVYLHQELDHRLGGEEIHALRAQLQSVDQSWEAPDNRRSLKPRRFSLRPLLSIAAILAIGILMYLFLWPMPGSMDKEALYAQYFEPYRLVLQERSAETTADATLVKVAVRMYEQGNFLAAAERFSSLLAAEPNNVVFSFYKALSELSAGQVQPAIAGFESLLQQKDHLFVQQSRWYLALAYLKAGEVAAARSRLEEISAEDFKAAQATEMLKHL